MKIWVFLLSSALMGSVAFADMKQATPEEVQGICLAFQSYIQKYNTIAREDADGHELTMNYDQCTQNPFIHVLDSKVGRLVSGELAVTRVGSYYVDTFWCVMSPIASAKTPEAQRESLVCED